MKNLRLDLANYLVIIDPDKFELTIDCKETRQEFEMCSNRTYDIPNTKTKSLTIVNVEYDQQPMEYIRIYLSNGRFLQVKLESSHEIVLDMFRNTGEHLAEFGAWDFWADA
jgi:translation initiation factor 2B subunit (eIF-2B alpha/beta/delta family)